MDAIVKISGKQFKVSKDTKLYVHRLDVKEGSKVSFDNVLLLDNGKKVLVGNPNVKGASVEAKVIKHLKDDKVIVFKKKRRKGYRVKNGHRQALSEIIIEKDTIGHPQFCPDDEDLILYAGPLTDRVWITDRSGRQNRRLYEREHDQQWITHESWWPGQRKVLMVDWPHGIKSVDVATGEVVQVTHVPAWHAAADSLGERIVCDTNFPDIGMQLIDLKEHEISDGKLLFESNATSRGDHWAHPFPYNDGPITVYAPQHTHPHPRFSPDGERVIFTSDCTGSAHVYEIVLRKSEAKAHA